MAKWEYKVVRREIYDHPYASLHGAPEKLLDGFIEEERTFLKEFGEEGWELVHLKEIEGKWVTSPENWPHGDPLRQVWVSGCKILYFKRQAE